MHAEANKRMACDVERANNYRQELEFRSQFCQYITQSLLAEWDRREALHGTFAFQHNKGKQRSIAYEKAHGIHLNPPPVIVDTYQLMQFYPTMNAYQDMDRPNNEGG